MNDTPKYSDYHIKIAFDAGTNWKADYNKEVPLINCDPPFTNAPDYDKFKTDLDLSVVCSCGAMIKADDIDYSNGSNEEGEDYSIVSASCNRCQKDYLVSDWGEIGDINEAIASLQNHINPFS